jgi:hypothetical protein
MTVQPATKVQSAVSSPGTQQVGPLLLVVLALLAMVAPLATDLYLPAFPRMTGDLATDATGVQMSPHKFPQSDTEDPLVGQGSADQSPHQRNACGD